MSDKDWRMQVYGEILRNKSRTDRILWGDADKLLGVSLSEAQRQALYVVAESKSMTIGDIAARLKVTNGAVTQLVDDLVQRGVVKRRRSSVDARKVFVDLTELGRDKLQRMGLAYQERFQRIFKDMTDEQIEAVIIFQRSILDYGEKLESA